MTELMWRTMMSQWRTTMMVSRRERGGGGRGGREGGSRGREKNLGHTCFPISRPN